MDELALNDPLQAQFLDQRRGFKRSKIFLCCFVSVGIIISLTSLAFCLIMRNQVLALQKENIAQQDSMFSLQVEITQLNQTLNTLLSSMQNEVLVLQNGASNLQTEISQLNQTLTAQISGMQNEMTEWNQTLSSQTSSLTSQLATEQQSITAINARTPYTCN